MKYIKEIKNYILYIFSYRSFLYYKLMEKTLSEELKTLNKAIKELVNKEHVCHTLLGTLANVKLYIEGRKDECYCPTLDELINSSKK